MEEQLMMGVMLRGDGYICSLHNGRAINSGSDAPWRRLYYFLFIIYSIEPDTDALETSNIADSDCNHSYKASACIFRQE